MSEASLIRWKTSDSRPRRARFTHMFWVRSLQRMFQSKAWLYGRRSAEDAKSGVCCFLGVRSSNHRKTNKACTSDFRKPYQPVKPLALPSPVWFKLAAGLKVRVRILVTIYLSVGSLLMRYFRGTLSGFAVRSWLPPLPLLTQRTLNSNSAHCLDFFRSAISLPRELSSCDVPKEHADDRTMMNIGETPQQDREVSC